MRLNFGVEVKRLGERLYFCALSFLKKLNYEHQSSFCAQSDGCVAHWRHSHRLIQLSFSKENEAREFVGFWQQPNGLAFRSKPAKNRAFAGEYPESNSEYLKTKKYDEKAAIGQITVSCRNEQCGKETE